MSKYLHWRVRITDPDGIHTSLNTAFEFVARGFYVKLCSDVGKHLYRVELLGIDAAGVEHPVEVCELRTDLYPDVQPEPRERVEQLALCDGEMG